jgi:hypothetical protein
VPSATRASLRRRDESQVVEGQRRVAVRAAEEKSRRHVNLYISIILYIVPRETLINHIIEGGNQLHQPISGESPIVHSRDRRRRRDGGPGLRSHSDVSGARPCHGRLHQHRRRHDLCEWAGKTIGGFAGGVGSAIADLIGYPAYAPLTLVVKGVEGVLVGAISDGTSKIRDVLAVIAGAGAMIGGYYLGEAFIMGVGPYAALAEVPGNLFQVVAGGVIGIPISWVIHRYLTTPRWQ